MKLFVETEIPTKPTNDKYHLKYLILCSGATALAWSIGSADSCVGCAVERKKLFQSMLRPVLIFMSTSTNISEYISLVS